MGRLKDNCYKLINLTQALKNCQSKEITETELNKIKEISESCEKEKDDISNFFDTLSNDEVIELLAVMYGGRDYTVPSERPERNEENYDEYDDSEQEEEKVVTWEEHLAFYKGNNDRDGAEVTLRSKASLIEYLEKGMTYFSI